MNSIMKYFITSILVCYLAMTGTAQTILDSLIVSDLEIINESIINTPNTEYSPVYYGDKVGYVYSSSRGRQLDKVINEPFYDLGYAAKDTSGRLALSASFSKEINSLNHEGPFCISGENIYFTRVTPVKVKGKKQYTRKIYAGNIYSDITEPLPFSRDEVSVCHPTISSDGFTMIFAADMQGKGHMDLYQSSYIGNIWSEPKPLAGNINSDSHEFFPNYFQDSLLIFASDRLGGYGGYDMYVSAYRDGSWAAPELIPEPLNSKWDDLGMILRADGKKGYFTSSRPGGKGKDDIYHFKSFQSLIAKPRVKTIPVSYTVLDKLRFVPLKGAEIKITQLVLTPDKLNVEEYNVDLLPGTDEGELVLKLSPKKGKELPKVFTDAKGQLDIDLSPTKNYVVSTSAEGYETSTFIFNAETYGQSLDIVLEPKAVLPPPQVVKKNAAPVKKVTTEKDPKTAPIIIPKEKGATIVFENIYYDYNSAGIKKGAAAELDALADALLLNANMEVLLISHTDSRGEANYNLMLSEERALSAKQYLKERGIKPSRISIRGSGEKEIRNKCKNGTPCTEEEHKYNRRTEVKILRI